MRNIKCLDCKYVEITESSGKGFLGESIIDCRICNKINGEMEECEDYDEKCEYENPEVDCMCCKYNKSYQYAEGWMHKYYYCELGRKDKPYGWWNT